MDATLSKQNSKEYDSYSDYRNDKYKIEKGMIIVLIKDNVELVYEYMPLFNNSEKYMEEFTDECLSKIWI